ncbi:uncharacterized protein si:dkey-52l18.4 isoform X1 [Xyrauchen texanus]|uniref:uncharacterized protein si:dkey-52l18.4 isoform X1 n=1 Tax=Xyrauchen texanus TaxID=154827 RepID=UPI0022427C69|nr:uncharacterized protein si:dkey-52l18.4 isoform X1 [Xyrauchen texanus]
MKTVDWCSWTFLAFLCILKVCECERCLSVRASRGSKFVPEGGSLQMSCEVEHCGVLSWTGGWTFQDMQRSTEWTFLTPSLRIQLSNYTLTTNSTNLLVNIQNINQSDAGAYKCLISWPQHITSSGHVTYVNVTEGPLLCTAESSGRKLSHRVLVYLGALMCCPLVLGVVWCLTQDHPPPIPPHSHTSYGARVKPKKELVYAEIALNDTRQNIRTKQELQPTVYCSLHFP